jgi:hypothetical protein
MKNARMTAARLFAATTALPAMARTTAAATKAARVVAIPIAA